MSEDRRCDVELMRSRGGDGLFVTRAVRVNGFAMPNVSEAKVIAAADRPTSILLEMFVTSVKDVEVDE